MYILQSAQVLRLRAVKQEEEKNSLGIGEILQTFNILNLSLV